MEPAGKFLLSPTVQGVFDSFKPGDPVSAWQIVGAVLVRHPEYAAGRAKNLPGWSGPRGAFSQQAVADWRQAVEARLNPDTVKELNGRFLILTLAELEPGLRQYLDAIDLYVALVKEIKEPLESLFIRPRFMPPNAGFISDAVDGRLPDQLNIDEEIANLAAVLTYKEVSPPLSLGLFGDWGSGKTYFMTRLNDHIRDMSGFYCAQEHSSGQAAPWCSRVVQITFNAWSYSDSNLWASLVTHIYEELFSELSGKDEKDEERQKVIENQVAEVKGAVNRANEELEAAKNQMSRAQDDLIKAQKMRQEDEKKLKGLIGDLSALFGSNSATHQQLDRAASALGYPQAAQTYEALEALNGDLKVASNRTSALLLNSFRSGRTLVALAVCVILLPLAVTYLVETYLGGLSSIGQRVSEISVFLTGLVAWIKFQVDQGLGWVKQVEDAFQTAQGIRQSRLEADPEVQKANKALMLAESQEKAAAHNLQNAQSELQRLQNELIEMKPERRLYRLIEERSRSSAYRQYLGIISLIRTDFEQISALLIKMSEEPRDFVKDAPPIQRIILYIDDLDRCRTERVVEVLEAVHLLLAFPLFVVVVGVDPRWLYQSLQEHFPRTLAKSGDGALLMAPVTTPQEYLEKIFQIPYALRAVEQSGYQNLVGQLIKPLGSQKLPARAAAAAGGGPSGPGEGYPDPAGGSPPGGENPLAGEFTPKFIPLGSDQLVFSEQEQADILLLWPLFRTPRSIKRYVNLYRLLRAGLRDPADLAAFEGTPQDPGEYQAAMLLLAVVTGYPSLSGRFLAELRLWMGAAPVGPGLAWSGFVERLQAQTGSPSEGEEAVLWGQMVKGLALVSESGFSASLTAKSLAHWMLRVARYSFTL